jgi:hypothetical protein
VIEDAVKLAVDGKHTGIGFVIVITGGPVTAFISKLADGAEVQPVELVTVKEYIPETRFETVVVIPLPVTVTLPGVRVNVHAPLVGNPLRTTLPVGTSALGCVIVLIMGGLGVAG